MKDSPPKTKAAADLRCSTCGARWSLGAWTGDCAECGGGALDRPCLVCGGVCGARWQRAVSDSHDRGIAHWYGACRLHKPMPLIPQPPKSTP